VPNEERDILKLFRNNALIVLSAFLGIFLAYVIQLSYEVFSSSNEVTSILLYNNATQYYGNADGWITQSINFSNTNLLLVIGYLLLYVVFAVAFAFSIEYIGKSSNSKFIKIILFVVLVIVIASWLLGPLIVLFSSYANPTLVFVIKSNSISTSDATTVTLMFDQLFRFGIFSDVFNLVFKNLALATFVLVSCLSLIKLSQVIDSRHLDSNNSFLSNSKKHLRDRKFLFVCTLLFISILPILVYLLSCPFSYDIYLGPSSKAYGTQGALYLNGIGNLYVDPVSSSPKLSWIVTNFHEIFLILWGIVVFVMLLYYVTQLYRRKKIWGPLVCD
jgi:hypothetical protein